MGTVPLRALHMRSFIILLLPLFSGCSQLAKPHDPDSALAPLIGKWCTLSRDDRSCVDHNEFQSDGTMISCAVDTLYNKHVLSSSNVELKGKTICMKVTESNAPFVTPIGYTFCAELLQITPQSITYRAIPNGEIFHDTRLPNDAPKCPPLSN